MRWWQWSLVILIGACADDGGSDLLDHRAPDFALTDVNPSSPTQGQTRTLVNREADVIVLYFAGYG
jgi:hypothetical protein